MDYVRLRRLHLYVPLQVSSGVRRQLGMVGGHG